MTPFLTVKKVAEILGCCQKHVRQLIKSGAIVGYRDSRRILINETSVLAYLEQRPVSGSHLNLQGQDRVANE